MFWRERERERDIKEQDGGPPVGQVRVLIVGDSGNLHIVSVHPGFSSLFVIL